MLRNGLELIVQYPHQGSYACRGFKGLRLRRSVFIAFEGEAPNDQATAEAMGQSLCLEILRFANAQEEQVPCRGSLPHISCHAFDQSDCLKLLVHPCNSPAGGPTLGGAPLSARQTWLDHGLSDEWVVMPVMPRGTNVNAHLPPAWTTINVAFWSNDPTELLWAVLQRAGLTSEDSRIFISYVRRDSSPIADQLFSALTEEGFDVFLDRCSVPVGVNFQQRLMQDLCDKAMVVFLNTTGVDGSQWVMEELATIKSYRLGVLELTFDGSRPRPDLDIAFARRIGPAELTPAPAHFGAGAQELTPQALLDIVFKIKEEHGRAIERRRHMMMDYLAAMIQYVGKTAIVQSDGTFVVRSSYSTQDVVISVSPRPPELGDFCALHQRGRIAAQRPGWVVSPAPFFEQNRRMQITWLGGISNIQHADEGMLLQLLQQI
jgi:hypothetical protein